MNHTLPNLIRRLIAGTVIILGVIAPSVLAANPLLTDVNLKKRLAAVKEHVEFVLKDSGVPGFAVGIISNGEVVFAEGFGFRDLKNKLPVTRETQFPLGSFTKCVTSMITGMLVDDGLIDLNEPVRTYLPEFDLKDPYRTIHATVRDVLSMRTGLAPHNFMWIMTPTFSQEQLLKQIGYLDMPLGFREGFIYCNLSIFIGGCVASRVANNPWEDLVRQRILKPLGMNQSSLTIDELKSSPDYALPYNVSLGREFEPRQLELAELGAMRSSGSLNASTIDVMKWIRFLMNRGKVEGKELISRKTLDEMWIPHIPMPAPPQTQAFAGLEGYGLAWFVGTYRGNYMISHGGAASGYHAFMAFFPDRNLGVFAVHNGSAFFTDSVVKYICDLFLDAKPVNWYAEAKKGLLEFEKYVSQPQERILNTHPSHPLEDFVGEYKNAGYGSLVVKLKDGALRGKYNESKEFGLEHWHYDTFRSTSQLGWLGTIAAVWLTPTFHADSTGHINRLSIPLEPMVDEIVFSRK
jgi:CubicO group peptidase (beta-lactamase class C family)